MPLKLSTKGWVLEELVRDSSNFQHVLRVRCNDPNLLVIIEDHERRAEPFIIEGWHEHPQWPRELFTVDWLLANFPHDMSVRNVHDWLDASMSLQSFVDRSRTLPPHAIDEEIERYYGKDAECPEAWRSWVNQSGILPDSMLPHHSNDVIQYLPEHSAVETLMCYLGIGDTFTPCHKDLCSSSGQNIMCYTENGGSSFWFMTRGSDAPAFAEYLHKLGVGQELDLETNILSIEELSGAPLDIFIAEQKLGDLVYVPQRSCHQVVNQGGITIKTSWSRMTVQGLETALYHELPIYRRVCRPEIYRVKSMIHHTLI
ncbi:hypothetical protein PUNSTDRAFT_71453, partial [Punctularia strigosozonata HHB-11173 SS5]|uniref:uncharacterized protein n=1 Tax=Punctularia strigosozonata (strain HHB-11173) TaxID=741275 RepID=UPI000441804C